MNHDERLKAARAAYKQLQNALLALNAAIRTADEHNLVITMRIHDTRALNREAELVDVRLNDSVSLAVVSAHWRIEHDFSKE